MRSAQKTIALWALLLIGAMALYQMYDQKHQTSIPDFNFSKFLEAAEQGELAQVTFRDNGEISGTVKPEFREKYRGEHFSIVGNTGDEVFKILKSKGLIPNYEKAESSSLLQSIFVNSLPLIVIFILFMFFMRQIQAGGGKAMAFGKSRARLMNESKKRVTFADVAGVEEAKEELAEIVSFLKEPKKYTRLGGRIPKGVLLVGSPGTGKTLLAKAVAGEAGVPFYSISGSDFVEMFVGVGASRVRDLFEQGKKNAPCLIFIDEIDAVGRHRGAGLGGGHDEREQTLDQLLVEMDGFEGNDGVILIAATNRPDILDPALLRPGRFDRRVIVNKPDAKGRKEIIFVHTKKTPLSKEVDIERIAKGTPGFSGADLENMVNEAALIAARKGKNQLDMDDFEQARDKVIMGAERKSMVISDEDKKITAYHEAGHTLVGKLMPGYDKINKVTIIPRGMALGYTQSLPEEDMLSFSRSKAENLICFLFGGRVAEEVAFKDITSGASNDIERATEIARRMVTEWGMSDKLGPQAFVKQEGPIFLGIGHNGASKNFSEHTAEQIDQEIKRIIEEQLVRARKILNDNKAVLDTMAKALLEKETIDGEEVDLIMKGGSLEEITKLRIERESALKEENKQAGEKLEQKEKEAIKVTVTPGSSDPVTV